VKLAHALSLLFSRPGLFARKSVARLSAAAPFMPRRAVLCMDGVDFECDFGLDPKVRDMYFAAYEPEEVALIRQLLVPGDVCVDAGANIGYFTALAASRVGTTGSVLAFEPVAEYYDRLVALRDANPAYPIRVHAHALGEREELAEIRITADRNIGWNTMVPGLLEGAEARAVRRVPVRRLDACLAELGVSRIALVKVDVEGFELPVLRGLSGYLERHRDRPVILCEVAPDLYPRLGARVEDLFDYLGRFGYRATAVAPAGRTVVPGDLHGTTNVVFRAG
jgi:FkbM family methyltransferase